MSEWKATRIFVKTAFWSIWDNSPSSSGTNEMRVSKRRSFIEMLIHKETFMFLPRREKCRTSSWWWHCHLLRREAGVWVLFSWPREKKLCLVWCSCPIYSISLERPILLTCILESIQIGSKFKNMVELGGEWGHGSRSTNTLFYVSKPISLPNSARWLS